jgi:hypothetical protein
MPYKSLPQAGFNRHALSIPDLFSPSSRLCAAVRPTGQIAPPVTSASRHGHRSGRPPAGRRASASRAAAPALSRANAFGRSDAAQPDTPIRAAGRRPSTSGGAPDATFRRQYQEVLSGFPRVIFALDKKYDPGKTFIIIARNHSPTKAGNLSAKVNGRQPGQLWIAHAGLVGGGGLEPGLRRGRRGGDSPTTP